MKLRIVALAALVALAAPAGALAETQEPDWTIGAGFFGLGEVLLASPSNGDFFLTSLRTTVPIATLFVERRLGAQSWLVLGAAGNVGRESFDAPPDDELTSFGTVTAFDQERGSLLVGLRRVVTPPGTLVDLSLLGSVEGGYGHFREERARQEFTRPPERFETEDSGAFASVSAGIAVERVLTGALALRISTPLVGFSWSRVERKEAGVTREGSTLGAAVGISPRIELRLGF